MNQTVSSYYPYNYFSNNFHFQVFTKLIFVISVNMRRRSDRGKTKPSEPPKTESSEKSSRKSHKHSRRRKKSSSSSEGAVEKPEVVEDIPQPLEVQVKDIELPQEEQTQPADDGDKTIKPPEEAKVEWKEDNAFWGSEETKVSILSVNCKTK